MWNFISEHWIISIVIYTVVVLFIARFAGFNQLDKG